MKNVDELTVNSGPYTFTKFLFANSFYDYSQTPLSRTLGKMSVLSRLNL